MTLRYLIALFFATSFTCLMAQTSNDDILFTVGGDPVYASEFLRVYNKNLDLVQDESQKDVDEYLKLFINYKLKLKEAAALELNTKPSYLRELSNYKKQLADSYMRDSKVTDDLVEEAYQRISYDVNATHILIKISEDASPQDTLAAYKQIMKLRDRAVNEGFEKVRQEVHNGQTIYGEKLGWFSGFKMVYKFETVAFNTNVGEISKPFRTRFGYHIVNILDKRKSEGERTVAHIMLLHKEGDSVIDKPEVKIQELYKKLQQGEDFESVAKQFSEDKNSASRGGKFSPFSRGQLSVQEFEDVAFGLENIGDISKPFKTSYGWHIVKLYDKKPIPSFEAIKSELTDKVKRDDRSKLIDEALINKLKKHYNIENEQPALTYFESIFNNDYLKRTWQLPSNFTPEKPLIKIGKKQFAYRDFANYLLTTQRMPTPQASFKSIIAKKYDAFLNKTLVDYYEDNLEDENEDFANIVEEYRDGLLLFDLMETTIWNAGKTDSIGVQNYYNEHKTEYVTTKRIKAVVASSAKQKILKKVSKLLDEGMPLEQIKSLVNANDKIEVIFTQGVLDIDHQSLPKHLIIKKGVSKIYNHNGTFVIVQIKDIEQEKQKTFEEAKGAVLNDYQNYKETNWLKELNEKYPVIVSQEVLQKIKSKIKNK